MIRRLLLLLITLSVVAGCAPKHPRMVPVEAPEPGAFFSAQGVMLNEQDVLTSIMGMDFILVGESHGNACDHLVQSRFIEMLARNEKPFVVGLEMVSVERQDILDRFNQGDLSLDFLPYELGWQEKWGYDFELYRPIFEKAYELGVPLYALNIPGRITRTISRDGRQGVYEGDLHYLPETIIDPPADQMEMLEKQFSLHQDFIQSHETILERFVKAQSIWDTKMASEAVRIRKKYSASVLILAGRMHVDRGYGIEHRLGIMSPDAGIFRIMPARSVKSLSPDNQFYFYCPPAVPGMRLGIVAAQDGDSVIIRGVVDGSRACEAGLEPGDIVVRAGDSTVASLADLHNAAVEAVKNKRELLLEILRNSSSMTVKILF